MQRDRSTKAVSHAAAALGVAALAAACASGVDDPPARDARPEADGARPAPGTGAERRRRAPRARCPAAAPRCASVRGRVVYVEAVDPDGDGDAHLVLAGGSVTAPGVSAIAIRRELRPRPLPRIGDEVSAAGTVWTGSYGQRQIEADVVHVARR